MTTAQPDDGSRVRIEPFTASMIAEVAAMLARAFVTNPLHVAAFGPNQLGKNEAFFGMGLAKMKGLKRVAVDGERIVGFVHCVQSPACQFSLAEQAGMLPAMIAGFGLRSSWRVGRWLSAWALKDPEEPHIHLGPIGVDPDAQGRGVGNQLMRAYGDHLDERTLTGNLETDRPGNVSFYRRFGFQVIAEVQVLGASNFLMRRSATGGRGRISLS